MTDDYLDHNIDMTKSKISSDQYLKIPMELIMVCGGDFLEAAILELISYSFRENNGPVKLSAGYVQNRLFGIADIKTIRRKLKSLSAKVLIDVTHNAGDSPEYSLGETLPKELDKLSAVLSEYNGIMPSYVDTMDKMSTLPWTESLGTLDKMSDSLLLVSNNSIDNNIYTSMSDPKGLEETNEQEPLAVEIINSEGNIMALTEVQSVLRVYHNGGSKFKHDQYKKSVANLTERFGPQIEKIITTYGQDKTSDGIREFLEDDYWQKNGLPLPAFLKAPWKWIPESEQLDGLQGTGYSKPTPRYQKRLSTLPASSNEQETAFREPAPAVVLDKGRMRAMRRNETLMILNSCGSALYSQLGSTELEDMADSDLEEWFMRACKEFKSKTGRDASVSSRPLVMEAA